MAEHGECPPGSDVYTLLMEEQRKVLDGMEAQASRFDGALKRNPGVWFGELEQLRARCRRN